MDEVEPDYDSTPPQTLTRSRHIDNVFWLAGRAPVEGQEHYDVMFVAVAPEEEEVARNRKTTFGYNIQVPPEYLKGGNGVIKDIALRAGIDIDKCYYTSLVKWLLPRTKRARPPVKIMKYGLPVLMDEIKRIKPRVIVCLGKQVFDMLADKKIGFDDSHGGWFWSSSAEAHLYVMYPPFSLVTRPELYETFRIDFVEIARKIQLMTNVDIKEIPARWEVIRDEASLRRWVERIKATGPKPEVVVGPDPDALKAVTNGFVGLENTAENRGKIAESITQVIEGVITWDTCAICGEKACEHTGNAPRYHDVGKFHVTVPVVKPSPEELAKLSPATIRQLFADEVTPIGAASAEGGVWPGHRDQYGNRLIAVDCEWHGRQHIDGQLRTIQFAWSESDAVVIEFRNEKNEWSFEFEDVHDYAGNYYRWQGLLRELFPRDAADMDVEIDEVIDTLRDRDDGDPSHWGAPDPNFPDIAKHLTAAQIEEARYAAIGRILAPALNVPDIKYIGHHFSADSLWMEHWLGLDVYQKCALDTEFAQQCVDESSELGLERGIAMKYTTLGFYNQDLIEWKRANRSLCEEGYGYIPSAILHPYGANDVLAPYRAYPRIRKQMEGQQLTEYYDHVLNPFVTDVFHCFAAVGLPMDRPQMDDMRALFHFARRHLEVNLKRRIHEEAKATVLDKLIDEIDYAEGFRLWMEVIKASGPETAIEILKPHVQMENIGIWIKRLQHMFDAKDFNIRSPDMMRRWLFDVEGLVPIKSTNQKAKGMPSMAWEKVLELPADRQKLYTPAVDKQTLQILSEQLETLDELLNLNAVGNVCKAFLKEADVVKVGGSSNNLVAPTICPHSESLTWAFMDAHEDNRPRVGDEWVDEGDGKRYAYNEKHDVWVAAAASADTINPGEMLFLEGDEDSGSSDPLEIVKENGLHAWLIETSGPMKDRVSCMTSTTETGRSRSWRPNTLNWPSYVNKRIGKSVVKAVREAHETGDLPETLMKWLTVGEDSLPSIRSCVKAPEGWLLVESDYKTAEMVGLAVISGDPKFIKILREPDPEWAVLKKGGLGPYVRVRYAPSEESGIPPEAQDPQYIMSVWKDGKKVGDVTEDDLERNADGTVKHRGYDIHWSIAERIYERPRESMIEKVARSAGKVINFCIAENQLVLTKERGEVFIQDIRNDDLLWDGDSWVAHEGVVYSGRKTVLFYEGLWASAEHKVWTCAGPMPLKRAIEERRRLERPEIPEGSHAWAGSRIRRSVVRLEDVHTYDVVNAGPQNRFTCSGVLVSNSSAYGASPASLERKIESDTGVKPEEGTGQKGLDAIAARQPRATEFLEEMAALPKTTGFYRAASGRIRHAVLHGRNSDVGWRVRNSQESAAGREFKNVA